MHKNKKTIIQRLDLAVLRIQVRVYLFCLSLANRAARRKAEITIAEYMEHKNPHWFPLDHTDEDLLVTWYSAQTDENIVARYFWSKACQYRWKLDRETRNAR